MNQKDKMAVIRLAGYRIHSHRGFNFGRQYWDWATDNAQACLYYSTRGNAIESAFRHFQQTHQNNA